jgi:putative ABC transport system permease protein
MVGIVLGILIGYGIATAFSFDFVDSLGCHFAAFLTSFIVAIVTWLYPAIKAAV